MATRSNICLKLRKEDIGKVKHFNVNMLPKNKDYDSSYESSIEDVKLDCEYLQIYHHWDGYPSSLGETLLNYFNDYDTILNLLLGGDASSINEQIIIQYASSRNEDWEFTQPKKYNSPKQWEEYLYLFKNGRWYVTSNKGIT